MTGRVLLDRQSVTKPDDDTVASYTWNPIPARHTRSVPDDSRCATQLTSAPASPSPPRNSWRSSSATWATPATDTEAMVMPGFICPATSGVNVGQVGSIDMTGSVLRPSDKFAPSGAQDGEQ